MVKCIKAKVVIGNLLLFQNKGYISKREFEQYHNIVNKLISDEYHIYDNISFEEFCSEYSFLVDCFKNIAIPIADKDTLIKHFRLELPQSVINVFDLSYNALIQKHKSLSYDYYRDLQDYLTYLRYLKVNDPIKAKRLAMEGLKRSGIINKNGNLKPPYNGKKVNPDDFTRGPKLTKK